MKDYTHINAALGVESLESVDGYVSLSEDQMTAIDQALVNAQQTAQELETAQNDLTAAQEDVQNKDQEIENLNAEIKGLKNEAGAEHTELYKQKDGKTEEKEEDGFLDNQDFELYNKIRGN